MSETMQYALGILLASLAALAAVLMNRVSERIKVPAPLLMLVGAAVAATLVPRVAMPDVVTVEHVVTIALVLVLFDGGMHIGWRRFRSAAAPIGIVGVLGTFLTAGAGAVFLHLAFGIEWYLALLVATAVAPTDPAVVFSVLGRRQIRGRSGTILEGESGANDPVGIALLASLLAAGGLTWSAVGEVGYEFLLQMAIGLAVGVVGGRALLVFMRRVPLPNEALYPLRTVFCALAIYGAGTVAHGSGFLAVFVAGILIGDPTAPYKREVERFHSALASFGEIVAFLVLGLTVNISVLAEGDVWVPGLLLGVVLTLVIRPVFAGLCLLPARLRRNELSFVLFAGLKGAVPILLGELLRGAQVPESERLYGIVVVVVVFSVLVQGSLVPPVAKWLKLPTTVSEPEPWALGVRLRAEPDGVHRLRVEPGSWADGASVGELTDLVTASGRPSPDQATGASSSAPVDLDEVDDADLWVSIVVRDRVLVGVRDDTRLEGGDEVVVLADPDLAPALAATFDSRPGNSSPA